MSSNDHCHYVVPRKKRRCRMLIKPGHTFCGEHSHLLESDQSAANPDQENGDRIPCPLDANHSVSAKRLASHLQKCPSKPSLTPDYIAKGINLPKEVDDIQGLTVSSSSDDQLLSVIQRIEKIYSQEIEIPHEILKHPLIEEEIKKEHIGTSASKHLVQNSSLLGHLNKLNTFDTKNANIIEFGSGRGQMTYWIAKAAAQESDQDYILIDKESHRHKFDNKLKENENLKVSRIRADIQDLVIEQIPQVKEGIKVSYSEIFMLFSRNLSIWYFWHFLMLFVYFSISSEKQLTLNDFTGKLSFF